MGKLFYSPISPDDQNNKQRTFGEVFGPFDTESDIIKDINTRFGDSITDYLVFENCRIIKEQNARRCKWKIPNNRTPGIKKNYVTENGITFCRACGEIAQLTHVPFPVDMSSWRIDRAGCDDCGYMPMYYCLACDRRPTYKDIPLCECKKTA